MKEKFVLINGLWIAIMEGDPLAERSYNHVALKVSDVDFDQYLKRVQSLDLEILEGCSRISGEGKSLYFYDYDNHLFELHTGTLNQRLESYQLQSAT